MPEGQREAADNRRTLNAMAPTVANYRLTTDLVFIDGFETGDVGVWDTVGDGVP